MEYTINPETDGICSLSEFMRHDCSNCPKKGMCDFIKKIKNELSDAKRNELSNNKKHSKKKQIQKRNDINESNNFS